LMLVLSMFVILLYNIFYVNCMYKFHAPVCVSTLIFYDTTDVKKII
jgi:hypothetical protein